MSMTVILAVGLDSWQLSTHSLVWRSAGYIVVSASTIREAIDHFKAGDFDLVLLGESISRENKERLTFLIRASGSRTPVASIANAPGDFDSFADATLKGDSDTLLDGISKLLIASAPARPVPKVLRAASN